jgi:hypothetical protein
MLRIPSLLNDIPIPRRLTGGERKRLVILINSWIMYYLLQEIYNQFLVKSSGGVDSLGEKWKELSESRRLYKPLRRGEFRSFIKGRGTKKEQLANRNPPINIDTRKLLNSLKPGRIIDGKYVANSPAQKTAIRVDSISLEVMLPYADDVQAVRPFIPIDIQPWLDLAILKALRRVRIEVKTMFR